MDALQVDEWYSRVRRAAPWKICQDVFLTPRWICFPGAIPWRFFCFSPQTGLEQGDRDIDARPGAQLLAVTSGGTIPDRACIACYYPKVKKRPVRGGWVTG